MLLGAGKGAHHDVCLVVEDAFLPLLGNEQHLVEEEEVPQGLRTQHPEGALRHQLSVRRQVFALGNESQASLLRAKTLRWASWCNILEYKAHETDEVVNKEDMKKNSAVLSSLCSGLSLPLYIFSTYSLF